MRTFTCGGCGNVFTTSTPEVERDAEAIELYAGTMDEEIDSCCDWCWLKSLEMISADPNRVEADKAQEMRAKFIAEREGK